MEKVVFNQLTIEVTRRCNMACGHCLRGDAENIDLTNMDIDSVLDQTEAIDRLIVTGGEPMYIGDIRRSRVQVLEWALPEHYKKIEKEARSKNYLTVQ